MALPENLPADLQGLVTDLERNEDEARKLMAGLTPQQLNWQPRDGKSWSILQCLQHLTLANQLYLDELAPAVERASPEASSRQKTFEPGLLARVFLFTLEPPVKFKASSPGAIQPASTGVPEQVLAAWLKGHDALRKLAATAAPLDLGSVTLQNPFFKSVTMKLGTALLILPAHERRHLWQAKHVKSELAGAQS